MKLEEATLNAKQEWCRSPCGERGLKCWEEATMEVLLLRRSPCGERGLK